MPVQQHADESEFAEFLQRQEEEESLDEDDDKIDAPGETPEELLAALPMLIKEIPKTEERAVQIHDDFETKSKKLLRKLKTKQNEKILMEYAQAIYPLMRHSYSLKQAIGQLIQPIIEEGYIRGLRPDLMRTPDFSTMAAFNTLINVLEGYKRKFALFDVSVVSAKSLEEKVLEKRINEALENVDQLMESLYDRLHDTKDSCFKLAKRNNKQSKLVDALRAHVLYLQNKYGSAVQARRAQASGKPEDLEASAMNLSQHMDRNKTLIDKLELEKRNTSALMVDLFRLTEVRAAQESQRMKGISAIIEQFQMNESFAEGIIKYFEHKLRKVQQSGGMKQMFQRRRGNIRNLTPNPDKIADAINEWMITQETEISEKRSDIEKGRITHMDYQEPIHKMTTEINGIREEHSHLDRLIDNIQHEIYRKNQEIVFKTKLLSTRRRELKLLLPEKEEPSSPAAKDKADKTVPPDTPSVYHDAKSPTQFETPAAAETPRTPLQPQSPYPITSPDYVDPRSPAEYQITSPDYVDPRSPAEYQITSPEYFDAQSPQPGASRIPPSKSVPSSQITSPEYFDALSPQPGPSRVKSREIKRRGISRQRPVSHHEKPQVSDRRVKVAPDSFEYPDSIDFDEEISSLDLPPQILDLSSNSPGGSGLNRTLLLTSPTRDPLLLDIDIDPKPLTPSEDGERFICDISLNVREAGTE